MKRGNYKQFFAVVLIVIILLTSIVVITNYKESDISKKFQQPGSNTIKPTANISYFGNAVNDFAFKIFKETYAGNEGNVFISPYSIFTALAMAYEGARGVTADEMANVLSIQQDNISFHNYMKNLNEQFNNNDVCNVSTANALWVSEGLRLLEDYLYVIENYYDGNSTNIDFSNPEVAAEIINSWIEEHTNDKIKDMISPDALSGSTPLVLTNAIYFKGNWKVQFDPVNTTDREFELSPGNVTDVPAMVLNHTGDYFNYTETDDLQILELPYSGDEFSMIILLPKNNDLNSVLNSIDNNDIIDWLSSFEKKYVDIYLPKFTIETPTYTLNDYLMELGMPTAFTSLADFSGIASGVGWISNVLHKAFVNVSEEGTEAAAATAIIFGNYSISSRVVFNADHPFMFLIQHKDTGTILFMGTVENPLK